MKQLPFICVVTLLLYSLFTGCTIYETTELTRTKEIDDYPVEIVKERGPIEQHTMSQRYRDIQPTLSRDGKYIFYASARSGVGTDLYLKPIHGRSITRLTQHPAQDLWPAPSPDSKRLAFVSNRTGREDIYIMTVPRGSSNPVKIMPNSRTAKIHPSWSPDGKRIVFSEFNTSTQQWELAIYSFEDNSVSYPREGINALFPEWCPVNGSTEIVFQHSPKGGPGYFAIRLINADGTNLRRLFESDDYACINPTWSPDGKYIAYATVAKSLERADVFDEADNIWAISSDGKASIQITSHEAADWNPCFSQDGRRIFFTSTRGKGKNIWSIPFRP